MQHCHFLPLCSPLFQADRMQQAQRRLRDTVCAARLARAFVCSQVHRVCRTLGGRRPPHGSDPLLSHPAACSSQIAQFAAELERYPQAIQIYEEVARTSVENNLLKYR